MASLSNNLSVLNIRGEDSVFLGNESLERNFLLSVLKRLAYDYKLFIFPQKPGASPPCIKGESLLGHRSTTRC